MREFTRIILMASRLRSTLLAAVLLMSMVAPLAAGQAAGSSNNAFGVEYEWSNLDDDVLTLTGLSMESILADVMDSADDAGMDLLLAQANTGSSSLIVSQSLGEAMTMDGVDVTPRITTVAVAHGMVMDAAFDYLWDDAMAEIDMAGSISWENMLNLAVVHTEYLDANNLLHAIETSVTSVASQDLTLALAGSMTGGGESISVDTTFSIASGWNVTNGVLEVGFSEPSELITTMMSMSPGDVLDWECTFDETEMPSSGMVGGEHWMMDVCDDVTGSYAGTSWFEVELTGAPSDLFDLPAGDWDVSISDSVSVSGAINTTDAEGMYGWFDLTETEAQTITLADGTTLAGVLEADTAPLPVTLPESVGMIGESLVMAIGEELAASLESTIESNEFLADLFADDGGDDEGYFMCDDGEEIPWGWVNDGVEDCSNGEDEYDGGEDYFICDDGQEILWDWVNDGMEDCSNGEDEGYVWVFAYEHCDDGEGLSSYACWDEAWDEDGDGVPEHVEEFWNYECAQLTDGSWECETDFVNHYDECAYEDVGYLECWLSEWDTDGDGAYDLGSDGYWDDECEQLTDGGWACVRADDDGDDVFVCDDGTEIPASWENDGGEDCANGEDEWDVEQDVFVCDDGSEIPASWENDGEENCANGEDEWDVDEDALNPSDAMVTVFEAIANSTFENAMETFGQNLEVRLEDQTEVILYHDAMAYGLWDPTSGSFVGAYLLVTEDEMVDDDFTCDNGEDIPAHWVNDGFEDCMDGSDEGTSWEAPEDNRTWVVLVGPGTTAYGAAPVGISVTYVMGQQAVDDQTAMAEQDSIEDLVDLTDYDPYLVQAVQNGIDPTTVPAPDPSTDNNATSTDDAESPEEGLLPAPGLFASLSVVALAAIAFRRD